MKVYKTNDTFYMEDNNTTVELSPNKDYYLKLPENSINRVWVSCRKVDNAPNQTIDYGDIVKTPRTLNTSKRPIEDYLNDEDRALYLRLLDKAHAAMQQERLTANSALAKAIREKEKWERKVAELSKEVK